MSYHFICTMTCDLQGCSTPSPCTPLANYDRILQPGEKRYFMFVVPANNKYFNVRLNSLDQKAVFNLIVEKDPPWIIIPMFLIGIKCAGCEENLPGIQITPIHGKTISPYEKC